MFTACVAMWPVKRLHGRASESLEARACGSFELRDYGRCDRAANGTSKEILLQC